MTTIILNDATSPFGRKVVVAAIERGIEFEERFVDVFRPGELDLYNPLRQIPTLVRPDGTAVFDSAVILAYLDTQHDGSPLVPADTAWPAWTRAALADGLMEAVLQRTMERRRPADRQDEATLRRLEDRIGRSLAALESVAADLDPAGVRGDTIAAACAVHYVDFRYGRDWRARHGRLAAWADAFGDRPSMAMTVPSRQEPCRFARERRS